MSVSPPWLEDYKASSTGVAGAGPGAGLPRAAPTTTIVLPAGWVWGVAHTEQALTLCLLGLLLLLLALLVVRCVRILLDPWGTISATSWSDHKEAIERGQFDFALG